MKNEKISILYIGDLLNNTLNVQQVFKKYFQSNIHFLDWTKYNLPKEEDLVDFLTNKIILTFQNLMNDNITIIVDSFGSTLLINAINKYNLNYKQIIIINPITNLMFIKSWTIKSLWIPRNNRNMAYKQMYLFHNFNTQRNNPFFLKTINDDLKFIIKNEREVIFLFNQILNYRYLSKCVNFLKKNINKNIFTITGEFNPLYSKNEINKMRANQHQVVINNSAYALSWESPEDLCRAIKSIIK